ncbi:YkvA family protein [Ferrovibrio sp.]|uniref:YkvA family protein n=1 Tax=Ferrovibrio sp. TaxID=1917215 RepID=UPI003D0CCC7B
MAELDTARFWAKFKAALSHLPWADQFLAAYYCATDTQTPARVKAILAGAIGYFILPLDAIPDFFVLLGYTDDLAVLLLAAKAVEGHITDAHRDRAKAALQAAKDEAGQP